MERGYEAFCLVDATFFDSPTVARDDDVDFAVAAAPLPAGWKRGEFEDWLVYSPRDLALPDQGWKIHASASQADAERTLRTIWDYCLARRIAFKFVRSAQLLLLSNGKYAHRGSSGKFVTIYPVDEAQFTSVLTELAAALDGASGPYILSDLRIGDGPLYVRYGGFTDRYCIGADGELEPAIEDDTGALVPDRRGATFYTPPWVPMPAVLGAHVQARTATTIAELPYRIDRPLHFSNGGGVYAGTDTRSGERVVLKEARPYAGLDMDGADATQRLRRERDMLNLLADLDIVPAVKDYVSLGGHEFLVMEYVEGPALSNALVDRYPLALLGADRGFEVYTRWALDTHALVAEAVAKAHSRDVVIGDLHPYNVLVRPDGRIVLIDLEIASLVAEDKRPALGDPAFASARDCIGFDIDRYALACLRLFMFMPLTELIMLDPGKAEGFATDIGALFPVPAAFLQEAVKVINGPGGRPVTSARSGRAVDRASGGSWPELDADPNGWKDTRESIAGAILASATPERDDRLFPGDIRQFDLGGLNLAYGAAGVLLALSATGAGTLPEHEEWLVRRARNPQPGTRFGFYDGLHGVAYALERLGRREDALAVLDIAVTELGSSWDLCGLDLFGGLAGIGLNLVRFASLTGDNELWRLAARIAEFIAADLGDEDDVCTLSGGKHPRAGLLHGSSGPALFFLRLFERNGDPALLDLAATALGQDLRRCILREDGALEVDEGFRTMPYLSEGSIGIGMVLAEYLRHADNERFSAAAAAIRVAAMSEFYIEPGLFSGRAGMILYLQNLRPAPPDAAELVAGHIRRLAWHAVDFQGRLAFPGGQLLRLSMDLATGSAGVLLALGAAMHDDRVDLPLFGPAEVDRARLDSRR
ncbi:MAG: protein kinase/lanthionine synthetase C family protein [Geodermatophilaceae bacterium]|nr:protein kinase/lanthionine synthetase C family protein [Geodermatophilaceae bacterium]